MHTYLHTPITCASVIHVSTLRCFHHYGRFLGVACALITFTNTPPVWIVRARWAKQLVLLITSLRVCVNVQVNTPVQVMVLLLVFGVVSVAVVDSCRC